MSRSGQVNRSLDKFPMTGQIICPSRDRFLCSDSMEFPKKLTILIADRDINRSKLARMIRVRPNTVSRWCSGDSRPSMDDAYRIARALCVSLDWLADPTACYPPSPAASPTHTGDDLTHLARVVTHPKDGRGRRKPPA